MVKRSHEGRFTLRSKIFALILTAAATIVAAFLSMPASAQFPAESTVPKAKRRPRPIAKASTAPAPRTKDGKVDLSGAWGYAGYTSDIAKDYDVGELPMTPFGDKLFKERQANEGVEDPEARCLPTGVPRRDPYPMKIVQNADLVIILFEGNLHSFRQIYTDGREHPKELDPTWWGHSIGHWEGNDVLVVDTIGFNGKTWLDLAGHGSSEQLHVIERYSRPDLGHLKNEITIEDPVYYTRPWKVTQITPQLQGDLMEYICTENERDSRHLDVINQQLKAKEK
jgi:hypothetical protein